MIVGGFPEGLKDGIVTISGVLIDNALKGLLVIVLVVIPVAITGAFFVTAITGLSVGTLVTTTGLILLVAFLVGCREGLVVVLTLGLNVDLIVGVRFEQEVEPTDAYCPEGQKYYIIQ